MEIVGRGFLAHHLAALENTHPGVVAFAAGVSNAGCTSLAEFAAEAELLYDVVRRCRVQGRQLAFFSTASADMYGGSGDLGREDGPVFPSSPYGRHKLALEGVIAASGADYLVLRLAHLVGPHQRPHQLAPALVRQIMSGTVVVHQGAGRDLIDVAHAVQCLDSLLAAGIRRGIVNVASGITVPVEHIIDHLQARLGTSVARRYVDHPAAYQVCIERLCCTVPAVGAMGFGENYYRLVLDRYLATTAVAHQRDDLTPHETG